MPEGNKPGSPIIRLFAERFLERLLQNREIPSLCEGPAPDGEQQRNRKRENDNPESIRFHHVSNYIMATICLVNNQYL